MWAGMAAVAHQTEAVSTLRQDPLRQGSCCNRRVRWWGLPRSWERKLGLILACTSRKRGMQLQPGEEAEKYFLALTY